MCHTLGLSPPYAGTVPAGFASSESNEGEIVNYPSGVCPRRVYYKEPSAAGDSPAALREKPSFTAVVTALARR